MIYIWKAVRFLSKQGQPQPRFQSKARSLKTTVKWSIGKNNSSARSFYVFVHFFAVLCKTTAWNDEIWDSLENVSTRRWIFHFPSLLEGHSYQSSSWILRLHCTSWTNLNNREVVEVTFSTDVFVAVAYCHATVLQKHNKNPLCRDWEFKTQYAVLIVQLTFDYLIYKSFRQTMFLKSADFLVNLVMRIFRKVVVL